MPPSDRASKPIVISPSASAPADRSAPAPVVAAPIPSIRQRRRPTLIVLGVTLAALGGLGGAYLASQGGASHTVLVAANQLTPGRPITAADLKSVEVGQVAGAETMAVEAREGILGQTVQSVVPAGTILNHASVVARVVPGPGTSIVGIGVKPGQMPVTGLKAGDKVRVVVSAGPGAAAQEDVAVTKPGTAWAGDVVSLGDVARDGTRTVDVALPADQALQAATASGTGALTLVLESASTARR